MILVLLATRSFSQSAGGDARSQKTPEADIFAIRIAYQQINSDKLTKKQFTYQSSGCVDGGVVNYYFKNNDIVKITESGAIGDGSWVNEYYYYKSKFFFGLETIVGGPAIGKVTKTQYRYYIRDGRPTRLMEGSKIIPVDSRATEMLVTTGRIYKAYTTKEFCVGNMQLMYK